MSGASIIGALLREDLPLGELVQAASIKGGALPDDVVLPALLVRTVSGADRQTLKRGSTVHVTERVSVAVRATSYREQKAAIRLIRSACAGKVGTVAEFERVAVLTAGKGPDLRGPGNSFEQTQDFRVSFTEPA